MVMNKCIVIVTGGDVNINKKVEEALISLGSMWPTNHPVEEGEFLEHKIVALYVETDGDVPLVRMEEQHNLDHYDGVYAYTGRLTGVVDVVYDLRTLK